MILVTGADGFIGSHIAESLVKKGYKVRAFVFYNSFNSWGWLDQSALKNEMEIFPGDIRDPYLVREAVRGCDSIIHLAALIGIPYSYISPNSYVDTNIIGTLNLLNAAKNNHNFKCFINTSTSEVYGTAKYVPIDENHPLNGQSPYAATKIGADQIAMSYFQSFNMPISIIRPFNTYGPRQSARAVIPTIISQILNNNYEISLGNIHTTRDFNFISDTVGGFISALDDSNSIGKILNIGSNYEVSIEHTVKIIAKIMNKDIKIINDKQRLRPNTSEVERLWCDNKLALSTLNWKPEYIGLRGFEKGLKKTIEWFSDENNLRSYKSNIYNY
jgi:NAD dependent epimerase/dehydratase